MADLIDLTGQRFGRLTVLKKGKGRKTSGGAYKATWICQCDCGNTTEIDGEKLRRGHTTSCGCFKHENKGSQFNDLLGRRFGRLTVIKFIPQSERTVRQYNWWCKCDCGNEIKANAYKLRMGLQQSCGCLKEDMKTFIGDMSLKYKYSNKRLYSVYKAMLDRCYNPDSREWHNYGGNGVKVYDAWLGEKGYDVFAEWAYSTGYDNNAKHGSCTLDRIDNSKGYCPENCRWITNTEQQNNRRNNVRVTFDGKTQTVAEWARYFNVSYWRMYSWIKKGKSLDQFK